MEQIGFYEAKTHLAELLSRVAKGESFIITRHGFPVARLCPIDEKRTKASQTIAEIRQLRSELNIRGIDIKSLFDEGRKH